MHTYIPGNENPGREKWNISLYNAIIENIMDRAITPQSLFDILKSQNQTLLVDVRPPKEYARWSMYNSINIPLSELPKKTSKLSKSNTVVLFCNHGNDSKTAARMLAGKGVKAQSLAGGLKAWNAMYDFVPIEEKHSTLKVYQCKRLGKGCLSYIIVLPDNTSAIIIDPTHHADVYLAFLKKNNWNAVAVLDTHIHADHISGGKILAKKLSVPYLLPKRSKVDFPFAALEEALPNLAIGASITCFETPGHTDEGMSILLDDIFLISGDTLFIDALARADFEEDIQTAGANLFASINQLLYKLKDRIHVLPAHTTQSMIPGPLRIATLRYVKLFNPIKDFPNATALTSYFQKQRLPDPPNYKTIKTYNRSKSIPKTEDLDELELGGNFCAIALPE